MLTFRPGLITFGGGIIEVELCVIEIVFGVLALLGTVVILMGAGDTLHLPVGDLFPLIGFGGAALIALCGVLLIGRGLHRRRVARAVEGRHGLRSGGLVITILILVVFFGVGLPLCAGALNVVRLGGFPLGYYICAQGALVGLATLAFAFAGRQDAIDAAEVEGVDRGRNDQTS